MSAKKELMINSSQSFSESEKLQGRTNLGALGIPNVIRSSFNISNSSAADNTLYTYTATAPCIIDLSVSIYANSPTLSGTLGLMVRWEPVNDSYNTDYFVLKDADHGSAFSRCVKTLSTGDVFRCAILNGNTSYPYTASGLIMGMRFDL